MSKTALKDIQQLNILPQLYLTNCWWNNQLMIISCWHCVMSPYCDVNLRYLSYIEKKFPFKKEWTQ